VLVSPLMSGENNKAGGDLDILTRKSKSLFFCLETALGLARLLPLCSGSCLGCGRWK
jgi:hypothetical protein